MLERYRFVDGKKLRCGYTTGSCAAAAALGAAKILLAGETVESVDLELSGEITLNLPLEDIEKTDRWVRCGVRKDAGDDKDVTDKILVCAVVSKTDKGIVIDGGTGVGRVTKKGMDQPVGAAAINSAPRGMIERTLLRLCGDLHYDGGLKVVIEVPEGEAAAAKTFNPRLGIEGGISILGTSGIVEPMSKQALIDTIRTEIQMKKAEGKRYLLITPGNYGLDFVRGNTALHAENAVKCSNYIGETLDMACEAGFEKVLLIGHIGKLVKLGSGIMNTHSRCGDGRMETLAACGIEAGVERDILLSVLES
ncbi:MAG: cobalt-precorrin-5B (C(1))-methyltransferase CbiD, partial [Alistipes sp.]|nr:cobalt-precorrin-5B (C(1))-methyltransferase CbiD [Alistipes sp.]